MLNPSMKILEEKAGNRYLLVNLASKRARDIAMDSEAKGIILNEKPVKMALDEIADGSINIRSNIDGDCD